MHDLKVPDLRPELDRLEVGVVLQHEQDLLVGEKNLEPCMTEIHLPLICAHYLVGGVGAGLLERLEVRPCA